MINKTGAHELGKCPLPIEIRSWDGSQEVDSLDENMKAATQKTQANYLSDEEARKGADYIWKGKLELLSIDKIIPGEWEDAYIDEHTKPGAKHYEPGYAIGKWRFTIQLYNPFWDEVVKEASTSVWEGDGDLDEPYVNLYSHNFSNLKEIILEYEKAPKKAEFESEVILVDPERPKRITFKVTGQKGDKPQKWQRLAVKVDFGTLTNGTPCCEIGEDAKFYSFMCEEGEITLEYKAPNPDKATFDHLTVYNGCHIKDPETIPMTNVDIQDEIGAVDIALINEGYSGTITITRNWDYTDRDPAARHTGSHSVTYKAVFTPIKEMEGLEGQPITIYKASKANGTWNFNENSYCLSKDCECKGLSRQEFGSGNVSQIVLENMILITSIFPTDNQYVASQLKQFGLENWYDIGTHTQETPTTTKSLHKKGQYSPCVWYESTSSTILPDVHIRYKLKDQKYLRGSRTWSSSFGTESVSVSDMTEAIYEQKAYEPDKPGNDFTYTVTWDLKALK
jgi:hypothetical protein